jgi:hypothetical protein
VDIWQREHLSVVMWLCIQKKGRSLGISSSCLCQNVYMPECPQYMRITSSNVGRV